MPAVPIASKLFTSWLENNTEERSSSQGSVVPLNTQWQPHLKMTQPSRTHG